MRLWLATNATGGYPERLAPLRRPAGWDGTERLYVPWRVRIEKETNCSRNNGKTVQKPDSIPLKYSEILVMQQKKGKWDIQI